MCQHADAYKELVTNTSRCGKIGCKIATVYKPEQTWNCRNRNTLESAERTSACRRHVFGWKPRQPFTPPKRTRTPKRQCRQSRNQGRGCLRLVPLLGATLNASCGYTYATLDYHQRESEWGLQEKSLQQPVRTPFVPKRHERGRIIHLPHPSGALAGCIQLVPTTPIAGCIYWTEKEYREPSLRHAERISAASERTWTR